jgi:3-methyladenine DNA glycosylase AlkD
MPEQAAAQIVRELRKLGDPRKAASAQRFFKEPVETFGVDTPTVRRVGRVWIARLRGSWHLAEAVACCDRLFQFPHLETRAVGFVILAAFHKEFDLALFRRAERWVRRHLDNWASVDVFATLVLAPLLRQHPQLARQLPRWSRSPCLWVRRSAVVALVPLVRHGEQLDLAYKLAAGLFREREDLMHKALGWLLREAGKPDAARLKAFLLRHRAAIPRTTVRYAIERFPSVERRRLLELTRRPLP